MNREANKGFRFFEFLVIVSIIAFLVMVGFSALRKANANARNAARTEEVGAYAKAAELYFTNARAYPSATEGHRCLGHASSGSCWGDIFGGDDALLVQFRGLMSGEPPVGKTAGLGKYVGYLYACTDASCQGYSIRYLLEGVGRHCGGDGRLVRDTAFGNFTYCQVIKCAIGTTPERSIGSTSPFACK